jgi:hypothetical protein
MLLHSMQFAQVTACCSKAVRMVLRALQRIAAPMLVNAKLQARINTDVH